MKTKKTEEALLRSAIMKSAIHENKKERKKVLSEATFADPSFQKEVWQKNVSDYINSFVSGWQTYFGGTVRICFDVSNAGAVRFFTPSSGEKLYQEAVALVLEHQPLPLPPKEILFDSWAPCELSLTFQKLQINETISDESLHRIRSEFAKNA